MDFAKLAAMFDAAGIRFLAVGGPICEGPTILDWSGFPVRVDGLHKDDQVTAQAVCDANPLTVDDARSLKSAELSAWLAGEIAAGYRDGATGLTLALDADSRSDRMGHFMRLSGKVATGKVKAKEPIDVAGGGKGRRSTVGEYLELLDRYGDYYERIRTAEAALQVAVQLAQTPREVAAVTPPARDSSQVVGPTLVNDPPLVPAVRR